LSDYQTLTFEIRGHVCLIGLNRPAKRNAFNLQMLRELSEAYTEYERDPELWCAVLHAHGEHFTAGLDLAEVGPAIAQGAPLFPEAGIDPLDLMNPRRTKPIVFAAQGYCFTIGVELCLACDIRLAASTTIFAQMEVVRGIMPFGGATLRLPVLTGWGNGMRYLLTGERFDAAEALRIGLIQEVAEAAKLFDRAVELATLVAKQAPLAVQASRVAARVAVEEGREAALAALLDQARRLMGTEDAMEGMMSFIQRREAQFKGR
jgi:enoyl-CoA hydratase/carnithine racemase